MPWVDCYPPGFCRWARRPATHHPPPAVAPENRPTHPGCKWNDCQAPAAHRCHRPPPGKSARRPWEIQSAALARPALQTRCPDAPPRRPGAATSAPRTTPPTHPAETPAPARSTCIPARQRRWGCPPGGWPRSTRIGPGRRTAGCRGGNNLRGQDPARRWRGRV